MKASSTSEGSEIPLGLDVLSVDQVQDLHDAIKKGLDGRQAIIPLTSKAFVIGSLHPDKDNNGNEQVLVRKSGDGADLEAMPRMEAAKLLEETIAAKIKKKPQLTATSKSKNTGPNTKANPQPQKPVSSLPFFEIKEEYDGAGNEVRAETVNMTKPLILVSDHLETNASQQTKVDSLHDDTSPDEAAAMEVDHVRTPISVEQYDALSARLDELARLEEETAEKARLNRKSAKKLQSKGWSKGFLAAGGSKPEKVVQQKSQQHPTTASTPAPVSTQSTKRKDRWSSGFLNKPIKQQLAKDGDNPAQQSQQLLPQAERSKTISFDGNNEIHEIPRVGQKSVSALRKPASRPVVVSNYLSGAGSGGGGGIAKPFDASVFTGVVKERPVAGSTKVISSPPPSSSTNLQHPQKKLSRFAQERQQQQ